MLVLHFNISIERSYPQDFDVCAVQLHFCHGLNDGDVALDLQLLLLVVVPAPWEHIWANTRKHAHHLTRGWGWDWREDWWS